MNRKYKKGSQIACFYDLMYIIFLGKSIWYKDKPLNAEFVLNMSIRVIQKNIADHNFFYCMEVKG